MDTLADEALIAEIAPAMPRHGICLVLTLAPAACVMTDAEVKFASR